MLDACARFFGCSLHFRLQHEVEGVNQQRGLQLVNGDGLGAHPHAGAGRPPEGLIPKERHHSGRAASNQPCRLLRLEV